MTRRRILDSYARESKPGDRRQLSVTGQHARNERRITELGATLGEKLSDQGKSAWKKGVVRKDWEVMCERLEEGVTDGAVIFDLERLMRTVEDALRIVKLAERGMEKGFKIYDSEMEYDLTTASGQKAFYEAAVAGQYYSHRLSGKVQRGHRQRAMNGEGKPGRYRPFGFERDSQTVRPAERDAIREVDRMIREQRKQWQDAIAYLTSIGIYSTVPDHTKECAEHYKTLTFKERHAYTCDCPPKPWQQGPLRVAMTNPRMAGYTTYRKDPIGELPGEPILEMGNWQALCAIISGRRGRPPSKTALCSGKDAPVRCGECGSVLTASDVNSNKTYAEVGGELATYAPDPDARRRQYRCMGTKKDPNAQKGCGRAIADQYVLDRIVANMAIDELSSHESVEEMAKAERVKANLRSPIEREIDRLESLVEHWDQRLNDGKMSIERHDRMVDDLERKIKEQKDKLTELGEVSGSVTPIFKSRKQVAQEWGNAEPAERRKMIQQAFGNRTLYVRPGSNLEGFESVTSRIEVKPRLIPLG